MTDDPLKDFEDFEFEQYEKIKNLPTCEFCGHTIQTDTALRIPGVGWMCDKCVSYLRRSID